MKKLSYIFLVLCILSCNREGYREDFQNHYDGEYTGLDTLINISGEFRTPNYLHHIVFYSDGLVAYPGHTPEMGNYIDPIVWKSHIWTKYIWGHYSVIGNTIIVEQFVNEGLLFENIALVKETFIINSADKITKIESTYDLNIPREFISSNIRIRPDSADCWLLKEEWFYK